MKILKLTSKNFDNIKKQVIEAIKEEKVIVLPTDTVYGLIGDATKKNVFEKIIKIKKRKKEKPFPIFVKDLKTAKKYAKISKDQEKFLKIAWPGKITAVLELKKGKKIYGPAKDSIGLRVPSYKLINEILKEINIPLIGTSANISQNPAKTEIKKVIKEFSKRKFLPDLIIDKGNLKKSKPSLVIDLRFGKILRS